MEIPKPVHTLVLDSGAIIRNEPSVSTLISKAESLITIPAIISEIRDEATRTRLDTLLKPFLTIRQPNAASIKFVTDFARRTGDLPVLSKPDLHIIALTYELECERLGGDWRLRRQPGQKELNGPFPEKEAGAGADVAAPAGGEGSTEVKPEESNGTVEESTAAPSEDVSPPQEQVVEASTDSAVESSTNEQATTEMGVEEALASTSLTETNNESKAVDSATKTTAQDAADSDSDGGEWITPTNLKQKQAEDANTSTADAYPQKTMQVAVLTTDFAMQNVILQINLNLLSSSLQRIRHVRSTALRCQACFLVSKEMNKQFCPRCGKPTLTRVSCSTTTNGEFKIHLKKGYQYNSRGDKYSIPKPVAGASNGRIKGGGKGGWGNELILAEDQKEYERAVTTEKRQKERNLMDEDYLPGILTGDRGRAGGRIKVGAGRNVNSKKR